MAEGILRLSPQEIERAVLHTLGAATRKGTADLRDAEIILGACLSMIHQEIISRAHYQAARAAENN